MSQLIGTWFHTDTGRALHYTVLDDAGAAMDVTGATAITLHLVRQDGADDVTDSITGSIYGTATNGTFEFKPIGTALATPDKRALPDVYDCSITFTISTLVYWTDEFRIAVKRFPV